MTTGDWITQLMFGGILGMLGQAIRVVAGLKKVNDQSVRDGKPFGELFDVGTLVVSLLIGFLAGALAVIGMSDGKEVLTPGKELIITLLGTGYAGTDFIEGFVKKYLPSADAGDKSGAAPASTPEQPAVG